MAETTNRTERNVEGELERLRTDFRTLQNDVSELTALLRDAGVEQVDEARSSASNSLHARREQLRARANELRGRGRRATSDFEHLVGDRPESSLAIAFGVGFLAAKIMEIGRR